MSYTNFNVATDSDGIALVTWDIPGRSMNVLDTKTIEELGAIVAATSADAAIKGVVITSGKDAFSAGADLSMLDGMNKTFLATKKSQGDEAAQQMLFDESRKLSLTLRKIETSGKPWVAAINGLALGGAFEVTLACHYRIASDNPKTRLGVPEIKVGLFPGGGGTQRLPRLLQPQDAMQMLLKGDSIDLKKAKAMGLVGAVVPAADLIPAAKEWIKAGGKAVAPWDEKGFKLPGGGVYSKMGMQIFPAGNGLYRSQTYDNYPAARAIMQCAYEGLQLPMDAALRVESRYFANVLQTKEAAAMIRSLFLSMQELNKGARRPQDVPPTKVKKLAVIGAGFMGASVGFVSARAGIDVVLIDRDQASADKGRGHAQAAIDALVAKGRAKPDDAERLMAKITATSDFNVLTDCDLVIEAVFEDRAVKAEIYKKAQPFLKAGAIFASNTSTLPINSLA
ncbi:MAG: 3-hydroxyacyl-CoA dehydrogenase, NAD-binding, partial [Tardiphaga sp.]|nr:3-hydroxyacyl-CoA dehydrogenase, NAD-binding [Tardiphaga sp.]